MSTYTVNMSCIIKNFPFIENIEGHKALIRLHTEFHDKLIEWCKQEGYGIDDVEGCVAAFLEE
jgi:hypothetical protein